MVLCPCRLNTTMARARTATLNIGPWAQSAQAPNSTVYCLGERERKARERERERETEQEREGERWRNQRSLARQERDRDKYLAFTQLPVLAISFLTQH